jgi:hypothetical protein
MTPSSDHIHSNAGNSPSSVPSPQGDLAQAQAFLDWWYGPALSDPQMGDMRIVLATISRKREIGFASFETADEAASWAVEQSTYTNVYTHIALHAPDRPKGKGTTDTAVCLPGLVADLDARSPYRSCNAGKAPDVASLRRLIADFESHYPFSPTLIESGYGIYACVRFREPLFFEDIKTRKEAEDLLRRFAEGFRVFGRQRGWPLTVDLVPLAGLVRLPGSLNRKGQSPILVSFSDRDAGAQ